MLKNASIFCATILVIAFAFVTSSSAQDSTPATSVAAPTGQASTDFDAIRAKSAALPPADKDRARQLFKTGFKLWQSGNFAAAEIGFKQGLDIDPANALANYYYGDCLARRKDKADAKDYLARAVAFGGTTAEGLMAQADLQTLSIVPTNVSEMSEAELRHAFVGTWILLIEGEKGTIVIDEDSGGQLRMAGKVPVAIGYRTISEGHLSENHIELLAPAIFGTGVLRGQLITPTRIEGTYDGMGAGLWSADKQ